jgi:EpsI family protein
MNLTSRLIIAAAILITAQAGIVVIHRGFDPKPSAMPKVGIDTLPKNVGDFVGLDEPLDVRTVAATSCDAMLNRVYRNRLGDTVVVNVGVWTDYELGIPHAPELCYPSAGWDFISRQEVDVPLEGDRHVNTKQFVFQRNTEQIAVDYWVHLGDQTISDAEGIRTMRHRLRTSGGSLPPLVKVMLHTNARDPVQAQALLSRFIVAMYPFTGAIR